MPSKTKLKNAAIAARSAALPKIPQELLDQLVQGPMTAESIQDVTTALNRSPFHIKPISAKLAVRCAATMK